ncbi:MAG: hypothetical protein GX366_08225 [Epulopiscium sp.]|nr:hypothetical protein [Candidatus Epulonipiscium sp.]
MITKKIGEPNIDVTVLYILYTRGDQTTSQLKQNFISLMRPEAVNLYPLENRNDTAIHQIVRNIVSHRETSSRNLIYRGLIDYDGIVLSITQDGIDFLDNHIISSFIDELNS